jgi:hypothetical protein
LSRYGPTYLVAFAENYVGVADDERIDGVPELVLVVDRRLGPVGGVPGALVEADVVGAGPLRAGLTGSDGIIAGEGAAAHRAMSQGRQDGLLEARIVASSG